MTYISYIDPGTGSMLFSLFIGIAAALSFGLRAAFLKLKFVLSGGKATADETANTIPYVIYSDHKRYWNVFRPICDEFEQRQIPLVYYTSSEDDPALSAKYQYIKAEFIGEGNKAFAKLNFLKADILLSTTPGLDVYQWKRSPDVKCYVHIPHNADDLSTYRMFALDYYDAVLATGQNQADFVRKIESLRPKIAKKEITIVGCTYLDAMKAKRDENQNTDKKSKKTVLVAPSWGKSGILSLYGEKLLSALAKTDYEIIIRPHPQSVVSEKTILEPLQEKFSQFQWNYDNNNFNVLNNADVMITDFSSVILDYTLVFDRAVIYTQPHFDTLPYDADWVDNQPWILEVLPQLGLELKESDFENVTSVIENVTNSEELQENRQKVRSQCWSNIGTSAKLSVDYLIAKQKEKSTGAKNE